MLAATRRRSVLVLGTRQSPLFCISFCPLRAILIYFVFILILFPNLSEAYRRSAPEQTAAVFRNMSLLFPKFGPISDLPAPFLQELYDIVVKVDRIEASGLKHVFFNSDSVMLAMNLFCSSSDASVATHSHIFIVLDWCSFRKMTWLLNLKRHLIFLLNFLIHFQLLLWNFESTICHHDTIFLSNLSALIPLLCGHNEPAHKIDFPFDCASFDFDFFHVRSSNLLVRFYHSWMKASVPTTQGPSSRRCSSPEGQNTQVAPSRSTSWVAATRPTRSCDSGGSTRCRWSMGLCCTGTPSPPGGRALCGGRSPCGSRGSRCREEDCHRQACALVLPRGQMRPVQDQVARLGRVVNVLGRRET
jgi:hypothetical protein